MTDLIKREDALAAVDDWETRWYEAKEAILALPAIDTADRIEELVEERDTARRLLGSATQMQTETQAKLAKAEEALPHLHAVLDILLNNFPTKARPKWVADTERRVNAAIAALAELEKP